MSNKRNPAIIFIFITIVIDVLGIGIIIPVLPKILLELTGKGLSEASQYSGYLMASYAIMQFVFSPIIGGLSDKFGRRPVILVALFGFFLDYMILVYAPTIGWLFVGSASKSVGQSCRQLDFIRLIQRFYCSKFGIFLPKFSFPIVV